MNKIHDDEQLWAEFREKFEAFVVGDVNKALQAGMAVPESPNIIYLNREQYARDFLEAQYQFFETVESNQSAWDNAIQRLKSQKGFLTVRSEDELVDHLNRALSQGSKSVVE
jgi:hypothetical protein